MPEFEDFESQYHDFHCTLKFDANFPRLSHTWKDQGSWLIIRFFVAIHLFNDTMYTLKGKDKNFDAKDWWVQRNHRTVPWRDTKANRFSIDPQSGPCVRAILPILN